MQMGHPWDGAPGGEGSPCPAMPWPAWTRPWSACCSCSVGPAGSGVGLETPIMVPPASVITQNNSNVNGFLFFSSTSALYTFPLPLSAALLPALRYSALISLSPKQPHWSYSLWWQALDICLFFSNCSSSPLLWVGKHIVNQPSHRNYDTHKHIL